MDVEVTTESFYDYNGSIDYNLTDSIYDIPLVDVLPLIMCYTVVLVLGVIGNTLVIFSIAYYRRMRTTTNVFLFSLATADLLVVIICIPIKAAEFLSFTWTFGEALCKTYHFVRNMSMICSVLTLAWIAIERVVAVSFPLKARYISTNTRAQITVILIWGAAFVLALPILQIQQHLPVGERYPAYWCRKSFPSREVHIVYEIYMTLILFICPLFVMMFSYGLICYKLWFVSEARADMRSGRVIAPVYSHQRSARTTGGADHSLLTPGDGGPQGFGGHPHHNNHNHHNTHNHSSNAPSHHRVGGGHQPMKIRIKEDSSRDKRTTNQLVIMLVVIVILFTLCWGPIMVDGLLVALEIHHSLNYGYLLPMRKAFNLMAYANSCVNPIVYAFMSKNFRQSFKFAICACVKGRAFVRAYRFSMSLANTRTSMVSTNGKMRSAHSMRREKSSSSENEYTKAMTSSPEEVELKAMEDKL